VSDAEGLPDGAYYALVTQALSALLASEEVGQRALVSELRDADAPDRLARHISVLLGAAIGAMRDGDRAVDGAALIERLIDVLAEFSSSAVVGEHLAPPPRVLEGVRTRRTDRLGERGQLGHRATNLVVHEARQGGAPTLSGV